MTASSPKSTHRVNDKPRISANQLGEYVLASPVRRQTILRNAKYAPTMLVIRYQAAKEALKNYLKDDIRKSSNLTDVILEIEEQAESDITPFKKNDLLLCVEAIKSFQDMADNKSLKPLTFLPVTTNLPKLPINGVEVSIRPDMTCYKPLKESGSAVGAVIFQTSKAVSAANWRSDHSKTVSTLLWMMAQEHLTSLGKVDHRLCLTIDMFGKTITPAPANYKRKLNDLEAACSEISALWEQISEPPDYRP